MKLFVTGATGFIGSNFVNAAHDAEETLIWNDPEVAIEWPIDPVIILEKDLVSSTLRNIDCINLET